MFPLHFAPINDVFQRAKEVFLDPYKGWLFKIDGKITDDGFLIWPVESDLNEQVFACVNPYTRQAFEISNIDHPPQTGLSLIREEDLVWLNTSLRDCGIDLSEQWPKDNFRCDFAACLFELILPSFKIKELSDVLIGAGAVFRGDLLIWPYYYYSISENEEEGESDVLFFAIDPIHRQIYELQNLEQETKFALFVTDEEEIEYIFTDITNYLESLTPSLVLSDPSNIFIPGTSFSYS